MKIKVFHVETNEYGGIISPAIIPHGFIDEGKFDAENLWHLCNWVCWAEKKPENIHSDIEICNHGVIFFDPDHREYWLSLSYGWIHGSLREIKKYILCNWKKAFWE